MDSTPHYDEALAALEQTLAAFDRAQPKEREALAREMAELRAMGDKLAHGRVDIVVFGEISTGKSALINALAGRAIAQVGVEGGVTRQAGRSTWNAATYSLPGYADSRVDLIDTPGLNEVAGDTRARMAHEQARQADLVLFVTDSDLNDLEITTLRQLTGVGKPVLLVLNKADLYGQSQRQRLMEVLRQRTADLLPPEHIVATSADPMERQYVIEAPDGSTREETRKPKPDVEQLEIRILELLEQQGKVLLALNGSLFAADVSDRLRAVKVQMRDRTAQRLIIHFAALKGAAVALNPIPIADVAGGFASDAAMVAALGHVYGEKMALRNAGGLAVQIAKSVGWVGLAELATHAAAHLVKAVTVGAGVVITALPQGIAAAYGSWIVGQGAKYYFEHGCGWAGQSPKKVVRELMRHADNRLLVRQLKDEILRRLHLARPESADAAAEAISQEIEQLARERQDRGGKT